MTNYLISLRDTAPDKPPGTPGTGIGSTTYIEVADDATDYNLITNKTEQGKWLSDLAGSAVLVFVHGFGNGSDKVLVRHNAIKRHLGGSLVSFDWPSGNPGPLPRQAYDKDKANALATAPRLMATVFRSCSAGSLPGTFTCLLTPWEHTSRRMPSRHRKPSRSITS